jgi:hypothetical protein
MYRRIEIGNMSHAFAMSISNGYIHLLILGRRICSITLDGTFVVLANIVKMRKKYHTDDVFGSHLIKHGFMEDYRSWNKHGERRLNEAYMRDLYLEMEVPISVD